MICGLDGARVNPACLVSGGRREVKRETGRRQEDAAHAPSSGARAEGGRIREAGRGWGKGAGTYTDKGRTVSEASTSATALYTYCRNLDLYSKSSKPSGCHESASTTYSSRSSPVECGCTHIPLEEEDVRDAQSKRTFRSHATPAPDWGHTRHTLLTQWQEAGTKSGRWSLAQYHYLFH